MLRRLSIRDFAIVESLELELGAGLTVFTGETGAGKSILVEALGFLLAGRGASEWLRSGSERLSVEGEFDAKDLDLSGLPGQGGAKTVVLRRELDAGGRSRAFVGGKPVPLKVLAAAAERAADFHGQHEHQTLFLPAVQLELLDDYGGLGPAREEGAAAYRAWTRLRGERAALALSDEERLQRIDLCRFQLREIDEIDPQPGEEELLAAELPRLRNAERLRSLAEEAYGALYEAEGSAEESLRRAERALEAMAGLDPALAEAAAAAGRARGELEAAAAALAPYREELEAGPERLDALISRQDKLARLKRKYGASVAEVLEHRERAREELAALENHEARGAELDQRVAAAEAALAGRCEALHAARAKAARRLAERAAAELKDLGLASARLSVSVELAEGEYSPSGADRVEFLIAPNPGEPPRPLRLIASGGELARVMLALKTVLARQDRVGLLVFDEVDTGVGAPVGRQVGAKLAELGAARQVLCVTHLPQVACFARAHLHVSKSVAGGRTRAKVERLEGERRVEAVAQMLGGRALTATSLKHAKELLESI